MARVARQHDGLVQGRMPGLDHGHQGIAHRAGAVIELDRRR